jgi:predicted Rossmann fold flavoprotein
LKEFDFVVIGGGAAGFFAAINAAEGNPNLRIAILERGKEVLTKVRISGGGRCNVTHAEFIPKELSLNYPRGEKELLGPFHNFMTGDTISWFESRGVSLKIEEDGRMFPVSNSSETIIECFMAEINRLGIQLILNQSAKKITPKDGIWDIQTVSEKFTAEKLLLATGSNPKIWKLLENLGHRITAPVPSLFTFNIKDSRINDLQGIATEASVKVMSAGKAILESEGALLITHWGMSGPAILKLSAWGARDLALLKYQFSIRINWLLDESEEMVVNSLLELKKKHPKQALYNYAQFELPKRLWQNLVRATGIGSDETWAEMSKMKLQNLANQLTHSHFEVDGKSTFKEEFVTAGGVDLKEINFKSFESKLHKNLFLAGEVLNIDAITGGFNFQGAWTGGYLVAKAVSKE